MTGVIFRPGTWLKEQEVAKEVGDLAEEQGDLPENQHLNLVLRWSITAVAKTHHKYCQRPKGRGQVSEMLTNSDHGW